MKKMRKLIPAFAMLMVAAIMMTTASFAWFTMNEQVTVSGMQIKAQASGSLLISNAPFSASNLGGDTLEVNTTVKNLKPAAYKGGTTLGTLKDNTTLTANGWYANADGANTNVVTGATDNFAAVNAETGFMYKEAYYIANGGEAITATLKVSLNAIAYPNDSNTHKAYSAAVYVVNQGEDGWEDTDDLVLFGANAATPSAIVHVGSGHTQYAATVPGVAIPSVSGAVGDATVGVKVIVCYYVDGALVSDANETTNVLAGYKHVAASTVADAAKWNADYAYYTFTEATTSLPEEGTNLTGSIYYVKNGEAYDPAKGEYDGETDLFTKTIVEPTDAEKADDAVPATWFVASTTSVYDVVQYTYVRSAVIPSNGATLEIAFGADL